MSISHGKPRNGVAQSVRLACRNCGVELVADARNAGKRTTCPECGNSITIPMPERADRTAAEEAPSASRGTPSPPAARAAEKERLQLQDEIRAAAAVAHQQPPGARTSEEKPPARGAGPRTAAGRRLTDAHRTRARLAGWLRRAVIVVLALTVIKVFDATFASVVVRAPANLHAAVHGLSDALRGIPSALHGLAVPRPVHEYLGRLAPLERFMLGLAMLIFATRLVVRTKLLDAVYVTGDRWRERTVSGLVFHFLFLVLQAALLAWAASSTWTPEASDGLTCGLIAATLWASALWLTTLHLVASYEYPELTKWMINDLTFGTLIFLAVLWPGLTRLWSRAGATAILFLADSAVALHVGASFVFARRPSRWWWRKPLSFVVTFVLLVLVALILACYR